MKTTQKALILAIIASLSSGQSLQAKYREMAKERAQKGYESLKTEAQKAQAKAEQAWQNVDKETLKKGAIAAGSIAAGTAAAAGTAYGVYRATQTGDTGQAQGAVVGRDILKEGNEQVLQNIISLLSSGVFKGNEPMQREFLLNDFQLTSEETDRVMKAVKKKEAESAQ